MVGTIASTAASACLSDDCTARAAAWLTAWDALGIHRTATAGDQAGADWLIGEAARLGAATTIETFSLDRLDPMDTYLEFDGARVPGVPVFDAPPTGGDGLVCLGRFGETRPLWQQKCDGEVRAVAFSADGRSLLFATKKVLGRIPLRGESSQGKFPPTTTDRPGIAKS